MFTFIMEYENQTFPEAVKILADRAGIALPEAELTEEQKRERNKRQLDSFWIGVCQQVQQ